MEVRKKIIEEIKKAIENLQKNCKCEFEIPEITLEHPADTKYGDFSTNIAMKIGKERGETPIKVAENIAEELRKKKKEKSELERIEVVNPGFINFYLSSEYLLGQASEIIGQKDKYGTSEKGKGKTVAIDYSHPNIAKPIGIHHSMTTLIGDAIKHIYSFEGYKTIADNFLGDWGTQFGKTIYAYKKWGVRKVIEKAPIEEILKLYVKFHEEAEKDTSLEEKGREEFKKLEDGDKENRELWSFMREETLKELNRIYKELNIQFDYYNGEAFYEDKLDETLKDLENIGLLKEGNEGAKIIDLEKENLGNALIQKGDGATLYLTRDIAAIKYRVKTYKPEKLLYVVEAKQGYHLEQLFEIAKKADYLNGSEPVHVKFGTMKFPEGGMSTRKGKLIYLWDVLEEAKARAVKVLEEKESEVENKEKLAKVIGVGAVKYAVLSQNRLRDVTFTWDKMLSFDGNSAPYIMYTFVRSCSILKKSKGSSKGQVASSQELEKEESDLLRKLILFPEVVENAADEYMPSNIATYIYELSQIFNTFYNKVPVLSADEDNREVRLQLVAATAQVLKNGMNLLNIELPEKM